MSTKIKVWIGIIGVTVICLLVLLFTPSKPEKPSGQGDGDDSKVKGQAPYSYTVVYEVGTAPVRVNTRFGYKADYRWGYAPVETRTNVNPEWLGVDEVPTHIEGGQNVQWREWRLSDQFEGPAKAKVTYTFTKVF